MSSLQVPNFLDRELFPELDDPPVNPAYLHMVAPMIGGEDSVYRLQINGEVFWQWRKFNGNASRIFCSLQISVQKLGYQLSSSSKNRLGKCLAAKTLAFLKALNNKTNGKLRQDFKTNTWKILEISQDDILCEPKEYIEKKDDYTEKVLEENRQLKCRCSELFDAMLEHQKEKKELQNKGKPIADVGKRQQQRQLLGLR